MILGRGFFVTPSDSVAIIAAYAQEAIPYFKNGPKVWNAHFSFLKNFNGGGLLKRFFCKMHFKYSWMSFEFTSKKGKKV